MDRYRRRCLGFRFSWFSFFVLFVLSLLFVFLFALLLLGLLFLFFSSAPPFEFTICAPSLRLSFLGLNFCFGGWGAFGFRCLLLELSNAPAPVVKEANVAHEQAETQFLASITHVRFVFFRLTGRKGSIPSSLFRFSFFLVLVFCPFCFVLVVCFSLRAPFAWSAFLLFFFCAATRVYDCTPSLRLSFLGLIFFGG